MTTIFKYQSEEKISQGALAIQKVNFGFVIIAERN